MQNAGQRWKKINASIQGISKEKPITIIGVTKHHPPPVIQEVIAAGLVHLGVNYAQDGELLRQSFPSPNLKWHFIGHIQSRKIKFLTSYDCIQSLDRIEIARELDKRLQDLGHKVEVLIEINIAAEVQKSGISAEAVPEFLNQLAQCHNLTITGLMGMPPAVPDLEARRIYFRKLFELFENHRNYSTMNTLSMGTSEDYHIAVSEGATMVRLGTTLFGSRK